MRRPSAHSVLVLSNLFAHVARYAGRPLIYIRQGQATIPSKARYDRATEIHERHASAKVTDQPPHTHSNRYYVVDVVYWLASPQLYPGQDTNALLHATLQNWARLKMSVGIAHIYPATGGFLAHVAPDQRTPLLVLARWLVVESSPTLQSFELVPYVQRKWNPQRAEYPHDDRRYSDLVHVHPSSLLSICASSYSCVRGPIGESSDAPLSLGGALNNPSQ